MSKEKLNEIKGIISSWSYEELIEAIEEVAKHRFLETFQRKLLIAVYRQEISERELKRFS